MVRQPEDQKPNLVLERLVDLRDYPLANLSVQAFDRDMRSEEPLGKTITDREGKNDITWLHSQLSGRGKKEADIVIKALIRKRKSLLFLSDVDSLRIHTSPSMPKLRRKKR